jgi:hypothetical protein
MITFNFKNFRSRLDLSTFRVFLDNVKLFLDYFLLKKTAKQQINQLVKQLKQLHNVTDVIVVKRYPNSLQEITFKLLADVDFAKSLEIEKKAIDLIIDVEWFLCDFYKTEDWHFDMELVNNPDFSFVKI